MENLVRQRVDRFTQMLFKLLASPIFGFKDSKMTPRAPGVYIIYDKEKNNVIYAGESGDLRRRLFTNHLSGNVEASAFRKALSKAIGLSNEDEISRQVKERCVFQFLEIDAERKMFEYFIIAVLDPELQR